MNYKEQLQERFPKLLFHKFNSAQSHEKSIIVCPQHGEFSNSYKELIRQKFGCKNCKPLVEKYLKGICTKHGQYIYHRYNSSKCPKCRKQLRMCTHEKFLKKLGTTDLTILSRYNKSDEPILIENNYGKMLVTPNHLLRGKIPGIRSAINKTEYCINQFKHLYKNFYDYSKVEYLNSTTKVAVVCPFHGEFKISPASHNQGTECKRCAYEKLDIGFTLKDFVRISNGRICTLYLVKISTEQEIFLKIGITSRRLNIRLAGHLYEVISLVEDIDAEYIFEKEKILHIKLKQYSYIPITKFNGYRECYNINHLKEILNEFRTV